MPSQKKQDDDERFSRVQRDPRFWEMPEKQNKVKIDKRFRSMFHDERFRVKQTVDKRGRPVQHSTKEDLRKFYQLSESEEDEDKEDEDKEEEDKEEEDDDKHKKKTKPGRSAEDEDGEDEGVSEDDEDDSGQDSDSEGSDPGSGSDSEDSGPDLARGKGNVETSSEEDSEDEVDAILRREEEEIEHDWGNLCKDAPRTEQVSRRLAVCNMDWDRIKAKDLLALLQSFCPKGGAVLSVKIFLSEFGKQRLQQEQSEAPRELRALPEDSEDDTEEEKQYRERMRQYQFRRLKYHYAVVECDRPDVAAHIYNECDGFEYESSGSVLDLRFVPDDVSFEEEPKDVSTDVNLSSYSPKLFSSSAASSSKVQLTWDETDHERVTTLNRKFNKDELLSLDFKAYLASSSEEEEGQEEEGPGEEEEEPQQEEEKRDEGGDQSERSAPEKRPKKRSEEQIHKYRQLLQGIRAKEEKDRDREGGMEVTWVPGLKQSAEQRLQKRLEASDTVGPWEQYLQKKKEKKKEKKRGRKNQDSEAGLSDDELPSDVDLNDPFFKEELSAADVKKSQKKKKEKRRRASDEEEKDTEEERRQRAQMELLMGEEPDEEKHKHFNFDRIVEQQNLSKSQRKRLKKQGLEPEDDGFQVDLSDPRFQAVFTSPLFHLDPSNPNFRQTEGTQRLLQEKQRRREDTQGAQTLGSSKTSPATVSTATASPGTTATASSVTTATAATASTKSSLDPGLSHLVKSVKAKTQQHQARKNRPQ
ncbi:ESF1 homolog [Periophthalmus magnuspinnatus]|uniref:ESF1 homolog n=1 Tax=Periophthalmus magnuspinnatus TaxID=409849 RepID=UPI00145AA9E4|nr:ESF1 homolog [Periophthalmus magnuspinnatus]